MTDEAMGDQGNTDVTTGEQTATAADEGSTTLLGGKPAAADEGTPESYAFTMPEGMEMDQGLTDAVSPILKELGLTQAQADKLVGAYAQHQATQGQAAQEAFTQQQGEWTKALKTDPDFGGEAFDKNAGIAAAALQKFGSPELIECLNDTGAGNNPALVKFVWQIGKLAAEHQPGSGSAATQNLPIEQRLYNADGSPRKTA